MKPDTESKFENPSIETVCPHIVEKQKVECEVETIVVQFMTVCCIVMNYCVFLSKCLLFFLENDRRKHGKCSKHRIC